MKDFIKLSSVFTDETCSTDQNHNGSFNKHYITAAETFNGPSGVIDSLVKQGTPLGPILNNCSLDEVLQTAIVISMGL